MLALVAAAALAAAPVSEAPSAKSLASTRPGLSLRSWVQFGAGVGGLALGAMAGLGAGCTLDTIAQGTRGGSGPRCDTGGVVLAAVFGIALAPVGMWMGTEALGMNSRVGGTVGGFLAGTLLIIPGVLTINAINSGRYNSYYYYTSSDQTGSDLLVALVATVMIVAPFAGGIIVSEYTARWDAEEEDEDAVRLSLRPSASVTKHGATVGFALAF